MFLDEGILKRREEELRKKYTTLNDGMYIQGEIVQFERRKLEQEFSVMIPAEFEIMPLDFAQIKYPSAFRPHWIFTSLDLRVNIGFSVFPDNLIIKDVSKVTSRVKQVLEKERAGFFFSTCNNIKIGNGISGCWFDFRSNAMDTDIYNMMLIILQGNRLFQGNFNCLFQEYPDWKTAALRMWSSIKIIER